MARNTHYTNTLVISGTTNHNSDEANLDLRVETDVINNPVSLNNKSANCYIINRAQKYEFPAYKGAYNDLNNAVVCTGGNAVRVIANEAQLENNWTDVANINIENLRYNPETNMISFEVKKPLNLDMVPNGNVVIALVNDNGDDDLTNDPIIWSWHFWFMSDYGDLDAAGWAKIKDVLVSGTTYVMDRNLGAMSVNDVGCYYKYGNKEPFFDGDLQGGGIHYDSNLNPVTPAWDSSKSPTDPCPPGYKVAGQIWATSAAHTSLTSSYYTYSDNISLPFSRARVIGSGAQTDKIEDSAVYPDPTEYSNNSTDYDNLSGEVVDITTSSDGKTQYGNKIIKIEKYYSNYYYSTATVTDYGYLWCCNTNQAYKYNHVSIDWTKLLNGAFEVDHSDLRIVNTKQPQKGSLKNSIFGSYWGSWSRDRSKAEFTQTQNETATSGFPIGTKAALFTQIQSSDEKVNAKENSSYTTETTGYYLPVRCVKE